jgi:hypothetical protein
MGLLPASTGGGPQALPAEGESSASEQTGAVVNNGNRSS